MNEGRRRRRFKCTRQRRRRQPPRRRRLRRRRCLEELTARCLAPPRACSANRAKGFWATTLRGRSTSGTTIGSSGVPVAAFGRTLVAETRAGAKKRGQRSCRANAESPSRPRPPPRLPLFPRPRASAPPPRPPLLLRLWLSALVPTLLPTASALALAAVPSSGLSTNRRRLKRPPPPQQPQRGGSALGPMAAALVAAVVTVAVVLVVAVLTQITDSGSWLRRRCRPGGGRSRPRAQ
mmetsp:Transcript_62851/g.125995  ORF Transcript_62851/g.125995 Transcript_62851/m.125995 type:complete len:236 (+) Transcript_62851:849-1556(+)